MNESFSLLDERWLPVCMTNGSLCEVSLLELFERVRQIGALAETSPASLIALYRMLLAITHRALSRLPNGWRDPDRADWYRQGLPQEELRGYLEQWRHRFWVFHPAYPFMQVAALATAEETRDNLKPWTQVSLANVNGEDPVVFDHSFDAAPRRIDPGLAIRSLLGFLQFTPGKLVRVVRCSDKAGPLADSAASVPTGNTLNETLCLGLHPCCHGDERDLPSWEKPSPSLDGLRADPSLSTGENDRYTRLSRAVLLRRDDDGGVQWVYFAAGMAMAEDVNAPDPMVSYRAGADKLIRLSFRDGRAFWRDLPALVPDAEGKAAQPAAVLGWAANLKRMLGEEHADQAILVAGVSSHQAKILRWRVEQIALPVPLLAVASLAGELREEVRRAEQTYAKLRTLAVRMLAAIMPDPKHRDTIAEAKATLDKGPAAATFFAAIEPALPRLLGLIAAMRLEDAHALWSEALSEAAWTTWDLVRHGCGQSPSALCAEARVYPDLRALLSSLRREMAVTGSIKEAQA
jgi:CRISPR system Cascade subunit CasA